MKPLYLIVALLAMLLINNLILLNFIGYFDEELPKVSITDEKLNSPVEALNKNDVNVAAHAKAEPTVEQAPVEASGGDEQFVESFQRLADSSVFTKVMDQWQLHSQKRYQEVASRIAGLSHDELFELAANSDSPYERQSAFQKLMQGNFSKLSVEQLKTLYSNDDIGAWGKPTILEALLDKGDAESIEWAKQVLQEDDSRAYIGSDLLVRVYEKDPEFVSRHIEELKLDSKYAVYGLVSLLQQEPDLGRTYMEDNFDRFLESDDRWMHQRGLSRINFELSDDHQQSLLAMMVGENRRKSDFSLGFVHRIADVNGLRSAFGSLQSEHKKTQFITSLTQRSSLAGHKQLARELANEMGNEDLMRLTQ